MNEKFTFRATEMDKTGITLLNDELLSKRHAFIGEIEDRITYPDGRVEIRKGHNIVVNSISRLIAAFIKGESGFTPGNLYWAFGTGQASWDTTPYTPSDSVTTLVNEVFRKPVATKVFIDGSGNQTGSITNRIELTVRLEANEANGHSLREFGIFGGNASGTKNSGIMLNHKVHGRIDKVDGMQIDRIVRFTF